MTPLSTNEPKTCVICREDYHEPLNECSRDGGALIQIKANPLVGTVFNECYEVESVLGFGAISIVYRVRHTTLDQQFALKLLHPHLAADEESTRRFELETRVSSSLRHTNVVSVYEAGFSPEHNAYLVLDFVDGITLEAVLDHVGFLPPRRAVPLFVQLCDGLAYAHANGILHRDLKPGNIMLCRNETGIELVKILDFGLAKFLPQFSKRAPQLTVEGTVCGTPHVMSPEQCLGRTLDARADIYSLGCLMYETLSGIPPLIGNSSIETMTKHVTEKPQPFMDIAPELHISWSLEGVIFKCLEKDPAMRYQSADEVKQGLTSLRI